MIRAYRSSQFQGNPVGQVGLKVARGVAQSTEAHICGIWCTGRPPMNDRPILAETTTPEGQRVVLFRDTWEQHILNPDHGHVELEPHLAAILAAIDAPDHRESDGWPHRERFFKHDVGPSRWLMVVVDSEQEPARVVTALGYRHGRSPDGWMP